MNLHPHTVGEHTPVEHAAELLARHRSTALPVVDVNGYLIGIVSEADLLGEPAEGQGAAYSTVGSVMTRDVISMSPGTDLRKVTHWLKKLGLRVMPITDAHGRLVGVVTRTDLVPPEQRPITGLDWIVERLRRLIGGSQERVQPPPQALHVAPAFPSRRRAPGYALQAADIMSTSPLRVRETTATDDAMALLQKYRFTALPVVDAGEHLIGIVSGADLLHDPGEDTIVYPQKKRYIAPRTVGRVMTTDVEYRYPHSDARELSHWLLSTGLRVMPIVDDRRRLVGVVTRSDLMRVRDELNLGSGFPVQMQPPEPEDRES